MGPPSYAYGGSLATCDATVSHLSCMMLLIYGNGLVQHRSPRRELYPDESFISFILSIYTTRRWCRGYGYGYWGGVRVGLGWVVVVCYCMLSYPTRPNYVRGRSRIVHYRDTTPATTAILRVLTPRPATTTVDNTTTNSPTLTTLTIYEDINSSATPHLQR